MKAIKKHLEIHKVHHRAYFPAIYESENFVTHVEYPIDTNIDFLVRVKVKRPVELALSNFGRLIQAEIKQRLLAHILKT